MTDPTKSGQDEPEMGGQPFIPTKMGNELEGSVLDLNAGLAHALDQLPKQITD
jgi:hypothetical protein